MAAIALVTADRVRLEESIEQMTLPCSEAIEAGAAVRLGTDGEFTNANATTATEAAAYGIALRSVPAGGTVTAVRRGVIDGFDLDAQDFWDPIYLNDTDGSLGDAAGTVSKVVGRVVPVHTQYLGDTPDKLLLVDFAL